MMYSILYVYCTVYSVLLYPCHTVRVQKLQYCTVRSHQSVLGYQLKCTVLRQMMVFMKILSLFSPESGTLTPESCMMMRSIEMTQVLESSIRTINRCVLLMSAESYSYCTYCTTYCNLRLKSPKVRTDMTKILYVQYFVQCRVQQFCTVLYCTQIE